MPRAIAEPPAMQPKLTRALWLLLGALGTIFTFLFVYRFMLHHYVRGPYIWDTAWFSYAIFQQGLVLPNLPHLQGTGSSLFTQHVYGLAAVLNPLSHLFSTHYHYFSAILGGTYALMFLGPFLAVRAQRATLPFAFVAFGLGLLFAGSGGVIAAIGYPHFEMGIPGFFILFLALHFLGFARLKWAALAAGVLVREDAGLHYLGYCTLIGLYQWWKKLEPVPRRTLLTTLAVSLGVSLSILFIQRHFFPLGESMFHKSYVGNPPFSHLTAVELGTRLRNFWNDASHLYTPALLIFAASLLLRAPAFALGYLAVLPWVVVNVGFSLTPAARTLSLYYGFPLMVGLAWPLFAPHWMPGMKKAKAAIPLVAVAAIASTYMLGNLAWPIDAAREGGAFSAALFRRFSACLKQEWVRSPGLYADSTIAGLFPDSVPIDRLHLAPMDPKEGVDGFVFFDTDNGPFYLQQAKKLGFEHDRSLPFLPIRIVSRTASPLAECAARD